MKIKKGHTSWLMHNIINLSYIFMNWSYISQAESIDRSYKQSRKHIQALFEPSRCFNNQLSVTRRRLYSNRGKHEHNSEWIKFLELS